MDSTRKRHSLLPDGAQPCVWMSAGLVAYRLCDRDFDCERCPLDAALRGQPAAPRDDEGVRAAWEFPADRRYAAWHLWAQPVAPGRVRVGIDALAAQLLPEAAPLVLPPLAMQLKAGDAGCVVGRGAIQLKTPVGGEVVAVNAGLGRDARPLLIDPYRGGWLMELERDAGGDAELERLLEAGEMERRGRIELRHLRRQAAMELLASASAIGPSMADGGEPLTDLARALGRKRYLELVHALIG